MSEQTGHETPAAAGSAKIIYILYLVSILIGITAIVGLIMAYVYRDDAPPWLQSHYRFQIRTFWIGALYLFIGVLLLKVVIGLFIILFWLLWLVVRCAKGMRYLDHRQAHPAPEGWMF